MERLLGLDVAYIVVGRETGDSGTPHLQGYVEFAAAKRFTAAKDTIGERAHIEQRRGKAGQAADYCKKGGDFEERGTLSSMRQGARTDLDAIRTVAAEEGMRAVAAIATPQQYRTAMNYLEWCEEARDWKPEVTWLWGATGVGKSHAARAMAGDDDVYYKDKTKWWNKYDRHPTVVFDDFRRDWFDFDELLRILDRYPHMVEIKGGYRQLLARRIIITTTQHPQTMFRHHYGEDLEQLLRRIDFIEEVTRDGERATPAMG